jgi:hypothetical protein
MIPLDDLLLFCNRTLDGYERAVADLTDAQINELPPLADPNSSFQLVTHALGAGRWWLAHIICGHDVDRDRDGEFTAVGTTADALANIADFRKLLHELAPELAAATELSNKAATQEPLRAPWTVGAALIHAYEELAQHLGHLEVTTDITSRNLDI